MGWPVAKKGNYLAAFEPGSPPEKPAQKATRLGSPSEWVLRFDCGPQRTVWFRSNAANSQISGAFWKRSVVG